MITTGAKQAGQTMGRGCRTYLSDRCELWQRSRDCGDVDAESQRGTRLSACATERMVKGLRARGGLEASSGVEWSEGHPGDCANFTGQRVPVPCAEGAAFVDDIDDVCDLVQTSHAGWRRKDD